MILISTNLFGQVKLKDLQGYWVCPNQDSAYFKKDTLILVQFQSSNFKEENKFLYEHCEFYNWEIKKKELQIHEKQFCKEPTTEKAGINYFLNDIEILKSRKLMFLIINKYGFREIEVFLVLNLTISKLDNYKTLKLKRIDFTKR